MRDRPDRAWPASRLAESCSNRGLPTDWVADVLDPDVMTFGFARRVPSYKRLTLMLRDPARLKALLTDPKRPIQIVIAGKSHPADEGGKALIQQMVQFADDPDVRDRIVFLPDYDISMAKPLYPGCDVWMNNPLRPYEACGTSGMKAALNGAANLSIRDGWWDEWFDPAFGWEIPSAEGDRRPGPPRRPRGQGALRHHRERDRAAVLRRRRATACRERWIQMIRETVAGLGPKVLASRMVRDYVTNLYAPAAASAPRRWTRPAAGRRPWPTGSAGSGPAGPGWRSTTSSRLDGDQVEVGAKIHVSALVRLGELTPDDIEVQLVTGRVDARRPALRAAGQPVPDRRPTWTAGCAATRAGSRPSGPAPSATPYGSCRTTRCWPTRPRWAWPRCRPRLSTPPSV